MGHKASDAPKPVVGPGVADDDDDDIPFNPLDSNLPPSVAGEGAFEQKEKKASWEGGAVDPNAPGYQVKQDFSHLRNQPKPTPEPDITDSQYDAPPPIKGIGGDEAEKKEELDVSDLGGDEMYDMPSAPSLAQVPKPDAPAAQPAAAAPPPAQPAAPASPDAGGLEMEPAEQFPNARPSNMPPPPGEDPAVANARAARKAQGLPAQPQEEEEEEEELTDEDMKLLMQGPKAKAPTYASYDEFFPKYLAEYRLPEAKLLRTISTLATIIIFVAATILMKPYLGVLGVVMAFGGSSMAHFLLHGCLPDSMLQYAIWALKADMRIILKMFRGQLDLDEEESPLVRQSEVKAEKERKRQERERKKAEKEAARLAAQEEAERLKAEAEATKAAELAKKEAKKAELEALANGGTPPEAPSPDAPSPDAPPAPDQAAAPPPPPAAPQQPAAAPPPAAPQPQAQPQQPAAAPPPPAAPQQGGEAPPPPPPPSTPPPGGSSGQ